MRYGICPIIARRNMHAIHGVACLISSTGRSIAVERLFNWLKEKRRLCPRCDKLANNCAP
ncbi:hypothetical protein BIS06_07380 [Halomonas sp. BBD48]|nr:hypothetical protein [Halomonas sp. BBD48]